jgi:hypothetical protein
MLDWELRSQDVLLARLGPERRIQLINERAKAYEGLTADQIKAKIAETKMPQEVAEAYKEIIGRIERIRSRTRKYVSAV